MEENVQKDEMKMHI